MIQRIFWKKKIIIGVCVLALASIAFQWLHNDFLGGLAFGAGLPLILLGLSEKRRHHEDPPKKQT
jgi:hypothetical protein